PLGAVRARAPLILKFAGELCVTVASLLRVILTLTVVEIASGTVQAKLPPAAGVEPVIKIGVTKLSVEYSSFTSASVPADVQVMFWVAPTAQTSPPTGAVRASEPLMLKAAETAETVASVGCFIRTLTVLAIASSAVHEYLQPVETMATQVTITMVYTKGHVLDDLVF